MKIFDAEEARRYYLENHFLFRQLLENIYQASRVGRTYNWYCSGNTEIELYIQELKDRGFDVSNDLNNIGNFVISW